MTKKIDDWIERLGVNTRQDTSPSEYLSPYIFTDSFLERCGFESRDTTLNECKQRFLWGTFGINREHTPNPRYVKLCECTTDHLKAILDTQRHLDRVTILVITSILRDREEAELS